METAPMAAVGHGMATYLSGRTQATDERSTCDGYL
jgi:hypothetical protein